MKNREIAGVKVFVSNEAYDEYKGTLQEQINELQSNWNSLREWLERKIELNKEERTTVCGMTFKGINEAMYKQFLDKMNELERKFEK